MAIADRKGSPAGRSYVAAADGSPPPDAPVPPARFRVSGRAAAVLRHHSVRRTDRHAHGGQDHRLTDQAGLFLRRPRCQPLLRPLAAPRPAHRCRRPAAAADRLDAPVPPPLCGHRAHLRRSRRRLAQQYHRAGVRWQRAGTIADRRAATADGQIAAIARVRGAVLLATRNLGVRIHPDCRGTASGAS